MPRGVYIALLADMYKDDIFFTSATMDQLSTYRMKPEMMKYSERFLISDVYKGLTIDDDSIIRDKSRGSVEYKGLQLAKAGGGRGTVSLRELQTVLLSKDIGGLY